MTANLSRQRQIVWTGIAVGTVAGLALWQALLRFLPVPALIEPMQTAVACSAVAALLTLLPGIEAIAHERLVTAAIDPLAGVETRRMRVNFRYLSNTLEQFVIFAAGLIGLAAYATPKLLIIVTIVWVLARWAFWIGYHRSPLARAIGAPGIAQSLLVLLYVAYRFGSDAYGRTAGIALVAIFAGIETILFWAVLVGEKRSIQPFDPEAA
jgi:MAPEG family